MDNLATDVSDSKFHEIAILSSSGNFCMITGVKKQPYISEEISILSNRRTCYSTVSHKLQDRLTSLVDATLGIFVSASMWLEITTCPFTNLRLSNSTAYSLLALVSSRPVTTLWAMPVRSDLR